MAEFDEIRVIGIDHGPALDIVEGEGSARAVIWPGMGARLRSIHTISLGEGATTIELRHPSEAVYYVVEGSGEAVDLDADRAPEVCPGSMIHVEAGTRYLLRAGDSGMSLVGGPAPADPDLYKRIVDPNLSEGVG